MHFFHVSGPVGGPLGIRAWVKIRFSGPKMCGIMWGLTTNFNLEDWWTLERARPVLVNVARNYGYAFSEPRFFKTFWSISLARIGNFKKFLHWHVNWDIT